MYKDCPHCQVELTSYGKYSKCEVIAPDHWCPIRFHQHYPDVGSHFNFRIAGGYLIDVINGKRLLVRELTGGCNEFSEPPILVIQNPKIDFTGIVALEECIYKARRNGRTGLQDVFGVVDILSVYFKDIERFKRWVLLA